MGLFAGKKNRLYHIEIDDEGIDADICNVIKNIQTRVNDFKHHIDDTPFTLKSEELQEIRKLMIKLKEKVLLLQRDIKTITTLKIEHEQFFIIKDDSYFSDKEAQLNRITEQINSFQQIIEQNPSADALKNELMAELTLELNTILDSMNKIVADDHQLRAIYKRIGEI